MTNVDTHKKSAATDSMVNELDRLIADLPDFRQRARARHLVEELHREIVMTTNRIDAVEQRLTKAELLAGTLHDVTRQR